MSNPNIDLEITKEKLKEIYSVRSSIAHGNFHELAKIEQAAKKKKDLSEQYPLSGYAEKLYVYVKEVLKAYLLDSKFVEFLKKS